MIFRQYDSLKDFEDNALGLLMQDEARNNLPVSLLQNKQADVSTWLLATVADDEGETLLAAMCTPPSGLVLCGSDGVSDDALELLAREIRAIGFALSGVTAERALAQRFARIYTGEGRYATRHLMNAMRLDKLSVIPRAPGLMRSIGERDLFYIPHWKRAFSEDSGIEAMSVMQNYEQVKAHVDKNTHYIWEDGFPVSQAAHGRSTINGAVINGVYTPSQFRGRGYASTLVAELSSSRLEQGWKFCCLFADAANPISCGIYRKLGYRDLCVFEEITFS